MHRVEALEISEAERGEEPYFCPEKSSQERGIVLLLFLGWILQMGVHFTMRMLWHAAEVAQ